MKKARFLIFLMVFMLYMPLISTAAHLPGLYIAQVPVISQSSEVRSKAVKQGLNQVLIKVSGSQAVDKNPYIKQTLNRAEYYVQEYSYAVSPSSSTYLLTIRFNAFDINRLLKKAGIVSWGETRPLLLVWAVLRSREAEEIISQDTNLHLVEAIGQQAKKYGLPVIFPMMDASEIDQISPETIANLKLPLLKTVSGRYRADALLIGRIERKEKAYTGQWLLVLGQTQWQFTSMGRQTRQVVGSALAEVRDALANHYLVQVQPEQEMRWFKLVIKKVKARKDLAKLLKYLNKMPLVEEADLSQIQGEEVELSMHFSGSVTLFQQNASMSPHLKFKSQNEKNNILIYEWIR